MRNRTLKMQQFTGERDATSIFWSGSGRWEPWQDLVDWLAVRGKLPYRLSIAASGVRLPVQGVVGRAAQIVAGSGSVAVGLLAPGAELLLFGGAFALWGAFGSAYVGAYRLGVRANDRRIRPAADRFLQEIRRELHVDEQAAVELLWRAAVEAADGATPASIGELKVHDLVITLERVPTPEELEQAPQVGLVPVADRVEPGFDVQVSEALNRRVRELLPLVDATDPEWNVLVEDRVPRLVRDARVVARRLLNPDAGIASEAEQARLALTAQVATVEMALTEVARRRMVEHDRSIEANGRMLASQYGAPTEDS